MEDAHQIVLQALEQAGVELPSGVDSVQDLPSSSLISIASKALTLILGPSSPPLPTSLPQSMADRFRICNDLAAAIKQLGYRGDLSFHQVMTPSAGRAVPVPVGRGDVQIASISAGSSVQVVFFGQRTRQQERSWEQIHSGRHHCFENADSSQTCSISLARGSPSQHRSFCSATARNRFKSRTEPRSSGSFPDLPPAACYFKPCPREENSCFDHFAGQTKIPVGTLSTGAECKKCLACIHIAGWPSGTSSSRSSKFSSGGEWRLQARFPRFSERSK